MGRWAVLAAALGLAGCNLVETRTPLFPPEPGVLKPGVWRADLKPHCAIDDTRPPLEWPDCAVGLIIAADGSGLLGGKAPDGHSLDLRLVSGDPLLIEFSPEPDKSAETSPYTVYLAGRATRFDGEKRATGASLWSVQCGPPEGESNLTRHPFAGLTVDREANSCAPSGPQALRDAARASEALVGRDDRLKIRWLRDGEK